MARSLKDATRPMDTTNLKLLTPPAATPRPALNNASADPEFSSLSLAPIPAPLGTSTDASRQFYRTGVSQIRMFPLPAAAAIAQGSQIATHVAPVADAADFAQKTATAANTTANEASATATGAATGVATINGSTAVAIVSGVLKQVPISTLDALTLTPNLDNLNDGTTFGRVVQTALTSGAIDSTKAGFLAKGGSTVPQIVGTTSSIISYTTTTTTATISWSSFTVFFADGTSATVSSGSQGVTGLTASTTYYLYAYLNSSNVVTFAAVTGGLGTPAILYNPQSPNAAQAANLQGVSALSTGGIQVITPSSGSGGGHGGGSGICLRAGQYIESKTRGIIFIEDVEVGDSIRGRSDWTRVIVKQVVPQNHFVRITLSNGERISLTPSHCTTAIRDGEEQPIRAANLSISDFLILREGYASIKSIEHVEEESHKVSITCEPEHEFYASESKSVSILVHNVQIPS
jgi:hypothetical protein